MWKNFCEGKSASIRLSNQNRKKSFQFVNQARGPPPSKTQIFSSRFPSYLAFIVCKVNDCKLWPLSFKRQQIVKVDFIAENIERILAINYFTFSLPFSWKVLISLGNFQEAEQTIIAFKYGKKTIPQRKKRQFVFVRDLMDEVMNGSDSWNQTVQKPRKELTVNRQTNCSSNFLHVFQSCQQIFQDVI